MLKPLLTVIKGLSTLLITAALGLELWHLWLWTHGGELSAFLQWVLRGMRFVVMAHGIEGIIAAIYARAQQQQPFHYGIYTFFVGFPGLMELFAPQQELP